MVINSPCLTNKKELAIPGQTATVNAARLKLMLLGITYNCWDKVNAVEGQNYQWGTTVTCHSRWQKDNHTKSSVRRGLHLADEEGVDSLPNSTIHEQLALMGYEKPS
ncbi:hypothetical protein Tco_0692361 [Tanacetum coccineum]